MSGSLTRYRVMAYVVGATAAAGLPWLCRCAASGIIETPVAVHGYAYMVYLVTVLDLSLRCKWQVFPRTLLIMLAGTVLFFSFYAEHKATLWAKRRRSHSSSPDPRAVRSSAGLPGRRPGVWRGVHAHRQPASGP